MVCYISTSIRWDGEWATTYTMIPANALARNDAVPQVQVLGPLGIRIRRQAMYPLAPTGDPGPLPEVTSDLAVRSISSCAYFCT